MISYNSRQQKRTCNQNDNHKDYVSDVEDFILPLSHQWIRREEYQHHSYASHIARILRRLKQDLLSMVVVESRDIDAATVSAEAYFDIVLFRTHAACKTT